METALTWALAHPLETVGLLVAGCVVVCLILTPGLWEAVRHGSPRC